MISLCAACSKCVYPTEKVVCLDRAWHKFCFKCQECGMSLNMKNYKGYEKKPYCLAHYPTVRYTQVAETPENKRLKENSNVLSKAKYQAEFQKQKGTKISVSDDVADEQLKQLHAFQSQSQYQKQFKKEIIGSKTSIPDDVSTKQQKKAQENTSTARYHKDFNEQKGYVTSTTEDIKSAYLKDLQNLNNSKYHEEYEKNIRGTKTSLTDDFMSKFFREAQSKISSIGYRQKTVSLGSSRRASMISVDSTDSSVFIDYENEEPNIPSVICLDTELDLPTTEISEQSKDTYRIENISQIDTEIETEEVVALPLIADDNNKEKLPNLEQFSPIITECKLEDTLPTTDPKPDEEFVGIHCVTLNYSSPQPPPNDQTDHSNVPNPPDSSLFQQETTITQMIEESKDADQTENISQINTEIETEKLVALPLIADDNNEEKLPNFEQSSPIIPECKLEETLPTTDPKPDEEFVGIHCVPINYSSPQPPPNDQTDHSNVPNPPDTSVFKLETSITQMIDEIFDEPETSPIHSSDDDLVVSSPLSTTEDCFDQLPTREKRSFSIPTEFGDVTASKRHLESFTSDPGSQESRDVPWTSSTSQDALVSDAAPPVSISVGKLKKIKKLSDSINVFRTTLTHGALSRLLKDD